MDNKYFIDVPITVTGLDGLVELADELKEKAAEIHGIVEQLSQVEITISTESQS